MFNIKELKELTAELRAGHSENVFDQKAEVERMDALCRKTADVLDRDLKDAVDFYNRAADTYNDRLGYYDEDPFRVLNRINVNEHVEKKNNLSYLSWAWAWQTLMELYPDSYTEINRPENGLPYWTDGKTCWVDVSVTVVWWDGFSDEEFKRTRSEVFPIMDYKNNSIPVEKITSFNVNTALQRAWTKCIARHGLGFYIYAGEDLPKEEAESKAEKAKVEQPTVDISDLAVKLTMARGKLTSLGVDYREEKFDKYVRDHAKVESTDPGKLLLDPEGMARVVAVMEALVEAKQK